MQNIVKQAEKSLEWQMKYQALAAGITDQSMIENAEKLVESAIRLAGFTAQPVDEVFYFMLEAIRVQPRPSNNGFQRTGQRAPSTVLDGFMEQQGETARR